MIRLILLSDFTESFSYNLLKGVLAYSKSHEPWVVCRMPPSYKLTYGIEGVLKWAKTWQADAIIGRFDNEDNVELFRQHGIIAIAQDYKARFENIPNITGDYRKTGKMAAEFFLNKGFQHFAFYGYRDTVWSQERCEGFYECIAERGFGNNFHAYQEQSLDDLWFYEAPPLLSWLKSLPHPTALMACDDNQGNRITEICKVNNIKVPDKIAILGVDNDEIICNLSDPPLSSISHNIVRGGFEAAELIDRLLNDEENNRQDMQDVVIQPINIVNRLSTDFYSTTDMHIHTALKYIHQNIASDITVSDIVKQVPLSRRLLEIRFKQVTQQSIHKYIFNLRMERFAQLLLASDAPIADVAEQVGINNLKNLSRQFKILKKVSPNEYRKEHQMMNRP
ncbi:transcriptional regulator [Bacteroides heparinolyticus]|uniref:AraC family transcriptional regulator n=5 Tax=Prevotella heparinolytica TaxID=28113 RepID=A0A2R3MR21_9BACE|nr:DNA-binding transcriptional regulator [Bacteroides heparinolyticus]AVM57365.1 transcriptional regulator [Bacteroides heparinolyticus]MCF0254846.1 DNA-binding transcriptional regulator [Bacteroides heparinolyticus]MCI6213927.1 DNA-binding transcriptional regulator [Bacteroides heparinolyticus]TCO95286.1 AraC family transcriptional regulator [Bacteroides heparinolyticus]VFB14031.1 AraC family transcriptional regulator [Bacteroides heparinolyticus]